MRFLFLFFLPLIAGLHILPTKKNTFTKIQAAAKSLYDVGNKNDTNYKKYTLSLPNYQVSKITFEHRIF